MVYYSQKNGETLKIKRNSNGNLRPHRFMGDLNEDPEIHLLYTDLILFSIVGNAHYWVLFVFWPFLEAENYFSCLVYSRNHITAVVNL